MNEVLKVAVERLCQHLEENGSRPEVTRLALKKIRSHFADFVATPADGQNDLKTEAFLCGVLYGYNAVGAITLDVRSATKAGDDGAIENGRLVGALRFDPMQQLGNSVKLVINEQQRQHLDKLICSLKTALLWQPSRLRREVRLWRVANIVDAIRLIAIATLCGQERKVWLAGPWLEATQRATIYGCFMHGTHNSWRVYV